MTGFIDDRDHAGGLTARAPTVSNTSGTIWECTAKEQWTIRQDSELCCANTQVQAETTHLDCWPPDCCSPPPTALLPLLVIFFDEVAFVADNGAIVAVLLFKTVLAVVLDIKGVVVPSGEEKRVVWSLAT